MSERVKERESRKGGCEEGRGQREGIQTNVCQEEKGLSQLRDRVKAVLTAFPSSHVPHSSLAPESQVPLCGLIPPHADLQNMAANQATEPAA